MAEIIGVRFRAAGKIYYFSPGDNQFKRGMHAIVETTHGIEYAYVVLGNREADDEEIPKPLIPVMRVATPEDDQRHAEILLKQQKAYKICREKIALHQLEMKLIDVEYTFDCSKILFYFTADGRVDFRALVKDLASVFRTRIELRQVGVRDETKILGGYGICGRPLCCHSFLTDFAPVSIKMAKEQGLSLNPTNISGVCGRLMCCLKNEEEVYEELNASLPGIGQTVTTPDGLSGEVTQLSVLSQKVKVVVNLPNEDEKEMREYDAKDLSFRPRVRKVGADHGAGCRNAQKPSNINKVETSASESSPETLIKEKDGRSAQNRPVRRTDRRNSERKLDRAPGENRNRIPKQSPDNRRPEKQDNAGRSQAIPENGAEHGRADG